jgi:hypothetical protein
MNKYIVSEIVRDMLKKEMNMVDYPLPKEFEMQEGQHSDYGKMFNQVTRYKAHKLKRIAILDVDIGGNFIGSVILIASEDEYDFPFIVVNVAFSQDKNGKDRIFVEFESKPLVKDEESTRKYIDPLRSWREAIGNLPSEPMSGFGEPGDFLKANISPIEYIRWVPIEYLDQILDFTRQFFEIILDYWRKAEPVQDPERRKKIDEFRREYNRHILDEDPSGRTAIETFGREKALLYFQNLSFI